MMKSLYNLLLRYDILTKKRYLLLIITVTTIFIFIFGLWHINFEITTPKSRSTHSTLQELNYDLGVLNDSDLSNLIDLVNFTFLLNSKVCNDVHDLFLLVFVSSHGRNLPQRQAIRSTWGNRTCFGKDILRIIFLVGQSEDNSTQLSILEEFDKYKDIVQGNFMDTYRNLTYKYVMGLKWVNYYCRNSRYILKVDDDIFLDTFDFISHMMYNFGLFPPLGLLYCSIIFNPDVVRSPNSKHYVSVKEYKYKKFPNHCRGLGIVMSSDVVFKIYVEAQKSTYVSVEDAFVTGVLAKKAGIKHTELKLPKKMRSLWADRKDVSTYKWGFPETNLKTILYLWNRTQSLNNRMECIEKL